MAKLTTEEFIARAKAVHGDRYDYSKVEYVNNSTNVCIICKKHGEFWQRPSHHIDGSGCPKCATEKISAQLRIWTKEKCYEEASRYTELNRFRSESRSAYHAALKHKWLKDYTWLITSSHERWTKDICYEIASHYHEMDTFHTENESAYNAAVRHKWLKDYTWLSHKIDISKKSKQKHFYSQDEIIERLRSIFGERYGYEKVIYKAMKVPITLVCHEKDANGIEHGEFSMRPDNIFSGNQGCPKCYDDRRSRLQRKPVEKFIEDARKVHGNLYEYHKADYVNTNSKVCIVCKIHGDFWQTPSNHLKGQGCPYCSGNAKKWNKETCEQEARKYKYIFEFRTKGSGACNVAERNGWLKEYTWLKKMPPKSPDYNKTSKYIYAYEFVEQKAVYVGLTNSMIKRDWQHRNSQNSSVNLFAHNKNCAIPFPKKLEENVPVLESGKREKYWVNYYKERGWTILNRAKTGERESSVGIYYPIKWNKKTIREKAKECGYNLSQLMEQYPGAYGAIQTRYKGLLNELFPHRTIHTHHTVEEALLVVKKGNFKKRTHLLRDYYWAYRVLSKAGLLDEVFESSKEYTKEEAIKEAENYRSIEQIRVKNRPLWKYLKKKDLFREAKPTDAMFRKVKTVEEAWAISQYYDSIADLSNHAKIAYRLLKEAGLLKKRYPNSRPKAVLQFSIDGEFIKEWTSAKEAAHSIGLKVQEGIRQVCMGKQKTAGGFIWKYKDYGDSGDNS